MRLAYVCGYYEGYLAEFYARHPGLAHGSFDEQKRALQQDAYGWAGAWSAALPTLGYEVLEIYAGVPELDAAWLRERSAVPAAETALASAAGQIEAFRPDVLFFDHADARLLAALKRAAPSVRLTVGWEGSTLMKKALWKEFNLMLSCAPESVDRLRRAGIRAEHLDHAFNPGILRHLRPGSDANALAFIGQIVRASDLHLRRERILETVIDAGLPLSIFSPSAQVGLRGTMKGVARIALYGVQQGLRRARAPRVLCNVLPRPDLGDPGRERPLMPVSRKLARRLAAPLYGLPMYQTIRDSAVTINIHADSSPTHASNARLFEITGAESCMLTDWKQNLPALFAPDREVVVYRDASECAEKARWLLDHPNERAAIARAGHARTMASHTFAQRAPVLDGYIREALAR